MSAAEVIEILKKHKKELYKKYNIKSLGIFGSYARGEENPESDIDILVEFSEVPSLFKYMEIERFIENMISKKVDIIEKYSIKKGWEKYILDEIIPIWNVI